MALYQGLTLTGKWAGSMDMDQDGHYIVEHPTGLLLTALRIWPDSIKLGTSNSLAHQMENLGPQKVLG